MIILKKTTLSSPNALKARIYVASNKDQICSAFHHHHRMKIYADCALQRERASNVSVFSCLLGHNIITRHRNVVTSCQSMSRSQTDSCLMLEGRDFHLYSNTEEKFSPVQSCFGVKQGLTSEKIAFDFVFLCYSALFFVKSTMF